ncbi:MAG: GTP diphosphokinase [Pseudomonadota bacterium]|nr:GTP diphosphokinase [Pseudomonadales bacterium]MDY6921127.1 GTP diphosphokinase [Pseudomonadota bacterium]
MVTVRNQQVIRADGSVDLDAWIDRLKDKVELSDEAGLRQLALYAAELAQPVPPGDDARWESGNSFLTGLEIAEILAELHLDTDALKAAVLYRAVREGKATLGTVSKLAGGNIAKLIEGVLRMAAISTVMNPENKVVLGQATDQLDNLRKMLVAMVDDVRVALIKLAERTCAIRAVKNAPEEKKQRVAREVFDIYAPLAHRLGIGHLKWELEDLSFRYLQPDAYMRIAKLLDEKRLDREEYIRRVVDHLHDALARVGVDSDISGRAKHIYSIWRKMKRKNIDFYQVYDIRAVRVLVPDIRDCYAALGVVHNIWQHIPREFDDYIATPKENGYRSLHTAVLGPEGKVLEVQIRTHDMHDEAELGVCAHWRYKEGSTGRSDSYDGKIAWLRQVLEWQEELGDNAVTSVLTQFNEDIVDERVYVFTPEGHVVDLAQGATPLDFAYHIHTEVGHRCRGAKVNGRIVPLNYQLRTGEQVEVLKGNESRPSRDWLQPSLGYLGTNRARAKVAHWFKLQDRDRNIEGGRDLLDKEFKRLDVGRLNLDRVARALNLKAAEDIYAAVGAGDLRVSQVLNSIQELHHEGEQQELIPRDIRKPRVNPITSEFSINGVDNLMTSIAGCCKPVPGDEVVGYISVGRGVTVHRKHCKELQRLLEIHGDRVVDVSWSAEAGRTYPVEVFIKAYDRQGLLRDITQVLAAERVNVTSINTKSDPTDHTATMSLSMDIGSLAGLGDVLARINQLSNVIEVRRSHQGYSDEQSRH